jgi:hypothetical protein
MKCWDGYLYEPVWVNPLDAKKRGICNGDIVKIPMSEGQSWEGPVLPKGLSPEPSLRIMEPDVIGSYQVNWTGEEPTI